MRFVLVGPRSAGNVGSAARALKNFGFTDLRVVSPLCDPSSSQGLRMAVGASGLLRSAAICDTLEEALEGATTVIGASRRTGKHRWPHYRADEIAGLFGSNALDSDIALVFGREDHGLSDQELDRCTHLVHIPSSDDYPSLNLAQSVLLMAWEFQRVTLPSADAEDAEPMAEHGDREAMYSHLQEALLTIGFLKEDSTEVIMRRIRRMLGRAGLSENEVRVMRGIAHQTLWAAGKAGLTPSGQKKNDGPEGA
jgi:tRNA/rRNA methyltransferase